MLTIDGFKKEYNGKTILRLSHASFGAGVTWIQGANGSGKSTLFKSIAGLIPFEGKITIRGIDSRSHPVEYRRAVSYSEAEPIYPPFVTGRDLMTFIAKAKQAPKAQLEHLIRKWEIESYFTQAIETYSSGMLKKISLASAFLGDPAVIILDEPLITLDEKSRNILFDEINQASTADRTLLLSSHQGLDVSGISLSSIWHIRDQTLIHE